MLDNAAHGEAPPTPPPERGRHALVAAYRRWFRIHEIEASPPLRWMYWALWLGFYVTFSDWIDVPYVTRELADAGGHLCWPYYQDCGDLYFLSGQTRGGSQDLFYAVHFGLLAGGALAAVRGRWTLAHALMLPAFLWKAVAIALLSRLFHANFHTYHLLLALILLLLPCKLYFLRRTFVLLYFLAASVKFHDGWILGTYFTAMHTGLPLVPDALVPLATLALIGVEMIGCWLLLSANRRVQLAMVGVFAAFHLYSIQLVGFLYPTMCLPPLLILFATPVTPMPPPRGRAAVPGFALLAALVALQLVTPLMRGDTRLTMEGSFYGLFMFEANHQCRTRIVVGQGPEQLSFSDRAMTRCDPYREWFRIRELCAREPGVPVAWTFDHAINGGPFYRMVNEADACRLGYRTLGHNDWIRTPEDGAEVVGQSARNYFRGDPPGTPPPPHAPVPGDPPPELRPELGALQRGLEPAVPALRRVAWALWAIVLALAVARGLVRPWLRRVQ